MNEYKTNTMQKYQYLKAGSMSDKKEALKAERKGVKYEWVNESETNPSHYKLFSVETWEMTVRIWGVETYKLHCEMNAFEYKMRAGAKTGVSAESDLKKAEWYLRMANCIKKVEEDISLPDYSGYNTEAIEAIKESFDFGS